MIKAKDVIIVYNLATSLAFLGGLIYLYFGDFDRAFIGLAFPFVRMMERSMHGERK